MKTARPFFLGKQRQLQAPVRPSRRCRVWLRAPGRSQRATAHELPLFLAYATARHRQPEPRRVPEDECTADSRQKQEESPGALAAASHFGHRSTSAAEPKGETPTTEGGLRPPHLALQAEDTAQDHRRGGRRPVSPCPCSGAAGLRGSPRGSASCLWAGEVGFLPTPRQRGRPGWLCTQQLPHKHLSPTGSVPQSECGEPGSVGLMRHTAARSSTSENRSRGTGTRVGSGRSSASHPPVSQTAF